MRSGPVQIINLKVWSVKRSGLIHRSGPVHRSGLVQGFVLTVRTGPDRRKELNDGPVRAMNLPDRCISATFQTLLLVNKYADSE